MKPIITKKVASAPTILSQAIESNGLLFLSGQIGVDDQWKLVSGGLENETKKAIENIKHILESTNSSLEKVVKVTIYVTNMSESKKVNDIYILYFTEVLPAREMVEVRALPLGAQVEISVIAEK